MGPIASNTPLLRAYTGKRYGETEERRMQARTVAELETIALGIKDIKLRDSLLRLVRRERMRPEIAPGDIVLFLGECASRLGGKVFVNFVPAEILKISDSGDTALCAMGYGNNRSTLWLSLEDIIKNKVDYSGHT